MKYSNRRCLVLNSWPDTLPAYENGYNIPVKKGFSHRQNGELISCRCFNVFFSFLKEYNKFYWIDDHRRLYLPVIIIACNPIWNIFVRISFVHRSSPRYKLTVEPGLRAIVTMHRLNYISRDEGSWSERNILTMYVHTYVYSLHVKSIYIYIGRGCRPIRRG